MRILRFKLEPSIYAGEWKVVNVTSSLDVIAYFAPRPRDLYIEDCDFPFKDDTTRYIMERKEQFMIALREAWDSDEIDFTVTL